MIRSVRIHEFGDADVLRIENVDAGDPASGEVRLRIHAIGLNRTEITLRSGRSPAKPSLPTSIGFEAAGVIEALGRGVGGFAVGDRVALVPAYGAARYALYGEVAIAPARLLVAIADRVSFAEAAATWAAYGTAWGGLLKQFVSDRLSVGAFHPTIARTFSFDQIADAHRFMEAGEQVGKIVVTL
jgi:NADPH:quinone reductase-like Zn-dependent oxidoreductase